MNTETSLQQQQPESPKLCVKGCGFFGTSATKNMCSKCYRDFLLHTHILSDAITVNSVENSLSSLSLTDNNNNNNVVTTEVSTSETPANNSNNNNNRCKCCNKKISMIGFKCKCGSTFCGAHRYPEEHNCQFDHKVEGKKALAMANPLITADKLQKL